MTESGDQSLLEFPCRFPIKMMGRDDDDFRATARQLVEEHAGAVDDADVSESPSRKGNFVSVTVTITATSQQQLDDIYRSLTDHEDVLVAL